MSYIKSESSDDELATFNVKDEPIMTFLPSIGNVPPEFKKKSLKFEECENFPDEFKEMFKDLENVDKKLIEIASKILYKWEDVPVIFPPSIIGLDKSKSQFNEMNLFPSRDLNELDDLALDNVTGKTKRLNQSQLDSIRQTGSFEVPSQIFNGQNHKWVLASWIQKGSKNTTKTFYKEISKALGLIVITAKRRLTSKSLFSVRHGIKSWWTGLRCLLDVLIGLPKMSICPYDLEIQQDLEKYLVAELRVDEENVDDLELFASKLKMAIKDPNYAEGTWIAPVFYKTADNLKINMSLYDPELKYNSIIEKLLELDDNENLMIEKLKVETVDFLKSDNKTKDEIKKTTESILFKEYMNLIYKKILASSELEALCPGLGQLLVERAKTILIIEQVLHELNTEMNDHLNKFQSNLEKNYKIRSLISKWIDEQLDNEREKFIKTNIFEGHLRSLKLCKDNNLHQSAYFIEREMKFYKEEKNSLEETYKKNKVPAKTFSFYRNIWLPKNYIIKKTNDNPIFYYAVKRIEYKNSTRYPFWRWTNLFMRTGVNFLNLFYVFGILIPFCSPLSLTALVSPKVFYPGKDVDDKTGALIKSKNKTQSYISRLRALWSHIRKSIDKFESTPDKGLLGKGLQRIFNRFWNYVIKGALGTVGLTLVFPPLCLLVSLGSLGLAVTTPIWVPILSIFQHAFFLLIWDFDSVENGSRFKAFKLFKILIWNFFTCGLLQPAVALSTSLVICPVSSTIICSYSIITMILRRLWDAFIYHGFLKRYSRVPAIDTFIARRVEGPNLAVDHFVQAKPEQVLAALEISLEKKILTAYLNMIKNTLEQPVANFDKLFSRIFNKYSFSLNTSFEGPYQTVQKNISYNIEKYQKEANRRLDYLNKLLNSNELHRIRLPENSLKVVILESANIVKLHYLNSILKFSNKSQKALFDEHSLRDGDWTGIAEVELEEIFGAGFLTPLEQTDVYFSLSIDHLNLSKYTDMLASADIRDDLDKVKVNYSPKSEKLVISLPYCSFDNFYSYHQRSHYYSIFDSEKKPISIPSRLPESIYTTAAVIYNHMNPQNKIELSVYNNIPTVVAKSISNSKF